jgi:hypothetical protein
MRQGYFSSTQEAVAHGWSSVAITVNAANIDLTPAIVKSVANVKSLTQLKGSLTTVAVPATSSTNSQVHT